MLKLRKSLTIVTILTLFCMLLSSVCFASEKESKIKEKKVVFKAEEITDFNILLEKAKKGESDLPIDVLDKKIKSESKMVNKETNETIELQYYRTSQLLEVVEDEDGKIIEEKYVVTLIDVVPLSTGLINSNPTWDSSGGVYALSTIHFSIEPDAAGNSYYKMTRGAGSWHTPDGSISLSNRDVLLRQMGTSKDGLFRTYPMPRQYPTTNTFSYSTPSNWPHVLLVGGGALQIETNATLRRGTSNTWQLKHLQIFTP